MPRRGKAQNTIAVTTVTPIKKPRKRARRRKGAGAVQQLIRHSPSIPFPQSMRVTFTCEADYKIAIATASITSGAVKLNSPWLPFRPGGSSAFSSYTFLGPATESTLLPTGWSNLANANMYQYNKVLRSRISIQHTGANSANNVNLIVFPAYDVTSVATVYVARTMPYVKLATFSASKPNTGCDKYGWAHAQCDPYRYMGTNRAESKADLYVSGSGQWNTDPLTNIWWHIYLQTNDLDVTATTASLFRIRVQYDVELYGLQAMSVT